jgi:hypothetical protein
MNTFFCPDCNITFDDNQGLKKEYMDYIGLCWKYIAYCPQCNHECSEKRTPKPGKSKTSLPASCASSGCSGGGCGMF